jgi:pimeloyl-ACP methyl ester carboxylesterase
MSLKNILFQQTPVFYRSEGAGHPVLLLHGFGEDGQIWEGLLRHLQDSYHWLVLDTPGSGHSPALPGSPSIEDWAAVGKSILDAEDIGACTVLGHSMGGYIALAMAELYPERVNGLGLVHSTAYADSEAKQEARRKAIAFMENNGAAAFLQTCIPGMFGAKYVADHPQVVQNLIERGGRCTGQALIQYYEAMIKRPDRTAVLQNADMPVLLLAGALDTAVPFEQSLQQTYLAKQTHVHLLRHSAHIGMLEEPGPFNKAVADFLAAIIRP